MPSVKILIFGRCIRNREHEETALAVTQEQALLRGSIEPAQ